MTCRGSTVVLLLVLALPGVTGWTQLGGDPDRAGLALISTPLDVLSHYRFLEGNERIHNWREQGLVETPHGLFGVAYDVLPAEIFGDCVMFRITDAKAGTVERGDPDPCWFERGLVGYDVSRDGLLLCAEAETENPVLLFVDGTTGATRWAIRPERDFGLTSFRPISVVTPEIWHCSGAVVDEAEGTVVLPFFSRQAGPPLRNVIAKISLDDGRVLWQTHVPTSVFFSDVQAGEPSAAEQYYYRPYVATGTDAGYALTGIVGLQVVSNGSATPARADAYQWSLSWLDLQGNVVGGLLADDPQERSAGPPDVSQRLFGGSLWAAAQGSEAVMTLVDQLVVINPSSTARVKFPIDTEEDLRDSDWWPGPRWWGDTLIVPLPQSVAAFDSNTFAPKWPAWVPREGWRIADSIIVAPNDLYVLAARTVAGGPSEAALFRLDLHTGKALQAMPLPIEPKFQTTIVSDTATDPAPRWLGRLQPLTRTAQLLVWDEHGETVLLGRPDAVLLPKARFSDSYPDLGEVVTLRLDAGPGVQSYAVHWGEGPMERVAADVATLKHRFTTPGARTVHITASYDEGRTATREVQIYPGMDAPSRSLLSRLAAPGASDAFWGILGLLLAGLGALYAFWRTRRHRKLLGKELAVLDNIKARGETDPEGAMHELGEFRKQIQEGFTRGTVEQAEFGALEMRIHRIQEALRGRILAPYGDRLTGRFRHLLEAALEDTALSATEAQALLDGLGHETRLSAKERASLGRAIRALSS